MFTRVFELDCVTVDIESTLVYQVIPGDEQDICQNCRDFSTKSTCLKFEKMQFKEAVH